MKRIFLALITFAVALSATPALAAYSGLGLAGNYNGFIFGNFSSSSDTEGRLAVGGNAFLDHYSVGDKLPADTQGDVLVTGGNLNFTGGRVYHGDIRVGGSASMPPYQVADGTLYTNADMPFSFAQQEAYLKKLSGTLSGLASNTQTEMKWGGLYLTGDGSDNLQVFTIDGSALLNAHTFEMSGINAGATVLVNVTGDLSGLTNMSMDSLAAFNERVLFNFYEATSLTLAGIGVQGSILAPFADIMNPQGQINGSLIAASFDGPMQLNDALFTGTLPAPTPIPGAIWLLGSGLVGLVGLRKKIAQ